jgi:hypothetical protein
MQTINVSGYNGTINNLTVNGTLTAAGFSPSGNLTLSGTTTCNGVLNSAGGFQQNGYVLGYLEAKNISTQNINTGSLNVYQFPTINSNTFSSSVLTVSGTGNSRFTNVTAGTIYVNISASESINNSAACNYINLWIAKSTTSTVWAINAFPISTNAIASIACSGTISLASNEYFEIRAYPGGSGSFSSGTSDSFPNTLTIKQVL